uniref:Uncharacterized protein n=1 Tax=Rhizophora mucronata TaxID=61149 RepID=A0A2P2PTN2_RHIMU
MQGTQFAWEIIMTQDPPQVARLGVKLRYKSSSISTLTNHKLGY